MSSLPHRYLDLPAADRRTHGADVQELHAIFAESALRIVYEMCSRVGGCAECFSDMRLLPNMHVRVQPIFHSVAARRDGAAAVSLCCKACMYGDICM